MSMERAGRGMRNILGASVGFGVLCVGWGIAVATRGNSTACITFLQGILISMGLAVVVGIGMVEYSSEGNVIHAFYSYIGTMAVVLPIFLCLMIVALTAIPIRPVMYPGVQRVHIDGTSVDPVREYSLSGYGGWLRRRMADDRRYWAAVSRCLRRRHACDGISPLERDPGTGALLAKRTSKDKSAGLSPIVSGCCKPPVSCGFTYVNQTTWISRNNTGDGDDCGRWSNDPEKLCFQCDSCKAGVLADVQRAWSAPVIVVFTFLLMQIVTLCVACGCAARIDS